MISTFYIFQEGELLDLKATGEYNTIHQSILECLMNHLEQDQHSLKNYRYDLRELIVGPSVQPTREQLIELASVNRALYQGTPLGIIFENACPDKDWHYLYQQLVSPQEGFYRFTSISRRLPADIWFVEAAFVNANGDHFKPRIGDISYRGYGIYAHLPDLLAQEF